MNKFVSSKEIAKRPTKEFVLLVGHPGVGKSYQVLALARYWSVSHPDNTVWILDTEGGLNKIIKEQFNDLDNTKIREISDAEDAIIAMKEAKALAEENDWIVFESLSRNWEQAQDVASQTIVGMPKQEYLSKWIRETKGKGSPVPRPDLYWSVAKDAHVRNIMEVMVELHRDNGINVLATTTLPSEKPDFRKSVGGARKEMASFLGINVSPDGAPRNAYYFDSVILLNIDREGHWASVLKDRGYSNINTTRFAVTTLYLNLQQARKEGAKPK